MTYPLIFYLNAVWPFRVKGCNFPNEGYSFRLNQTNGLLKDGAVR